MSIKPEFAESILNGTKSVEFRRVLFKSKSVKTVILYASHPVKKVVGEFQISGTLSLDVAMLWKHTAEHAGIDESYFFSYFNGKAIGHAIKIANPRRYRRPLDLTEKYSVRRPPQSFQYLPN